MYAHKGRTKKLKCHGLHGFALDQPSINGIGMNWSKLVQLIVQKNETVGNMMRPKLVQHARNAVFFLKVQRCPRGNGWKQSEIAPSLGKKVVRLISDCFQPFPLGHLWTFKKKNGIARKCLFKKKCGLDKFWPDHVSDCFRPFPTVSFFLND